MVPPRDIQIAQGFQFTRPLRTLVDVVKAGTVERAFLRQAVRQASGRGPITRTAIRSKGPFRSGIVSQFLPAHKTAAEGISRSALRVSRDADGLDLQMLGALTSGTVLIRLLSVLPSKPLIASTEG
jgi:hypothetical protein